MTFDVSDFELLLQYPKIFFFNFFFKKGLFPVQLDPLVDTTLFTDTYVC